MIKQLTATREGLGYYSFKTQNYTKISDTAEIPMWLPDSRRVAYARQGKAFILDVETGKEKEIPLPQPEEIATVGVSRADDLFYFTVRSSESDIWLLDASQNE